MEKQVQIKMANRLRNSARYTLLTVSILVFIFALLSGSEDTGGGLKGIILNSPNALPWLLLLFFTFVAWKWELVGGIIITLTGFGIIYFFNFMGNNFFIATFILTLLIVLLGTSFILSWYFRRNLE